MGPHLRGVDPERKAKMAPTYNGWEDTPEDEREALDQWEATRNRITRSSRAMPRPLTTGGGYILGITTTSDHR